MTSLSQLSRSALACRGFRFIIALLVVICFPASVVKTEEVTLPVIDGMTLNLGNYVQTVRVRAASMGPGVCAVEFSVGVAGSGKLGFLARPGTWSPWTDIPHGFIGAMSTTLRFSALCDTGAIAQVKFHR